MASRRMKPKSVCPRCEGFMHRKTAISEGVGARHWGDVDAFLQLGGVDIHHYICISCGNVSAYQERFQFEGFKKKKPRPRASA